MGYHSFKRVLGVTRLERRCRTFFFISLLTLIGGAFCFVEYKAEQMVMRTTRQKGRDLVSMSLMKFHFQVWENDPKRKNLVEATISSLDEQDYTYEFLSFEDGPNERRPKDKWEQERLQEFHDELLEWSHQNWEPIQVEKKVDAPDAEEAAAEPNELLANLYRERILPSQNEYHYLQPVIYWKNEKKCFHCHVTDSSAALSMAMQDQNQVRPFRVVKVVMPYGEVRKATNNARAVLIAVAIGTVVGAMVLLYFIVHHVIVRPLEHLREVSDEISKGNVDIRAELTTNDEFEELATSFNRMVRHLVETQANLRELNVDLDAKIDELAQANMRLYEMNRLKGDFLANMSHELRTPLNSIIGFSDVLQGLDSLTDQQRRYARNIQKSGRLLLDTINDILDLAKMEAGKMEVRLGEFRIDALVNAQCDMVRPLTEEKNVDLEMRIADSLPPLFQDQAKVQQVLTNLLSNAIKFTPEGGRITVSAKQIGDERLELRVSDTGVGIAKQDLEVIFEKFRQGKATTGEDSLTREHSGTGLGLSIVRELCILLGGEVSLESEVGKGSDFVVELPWNGPGATTDVVSNQLRDIQAQASARDLAPTLHQRITGDQETTKSGPPEDKPLANVTE